jgi:6-phosphogluconolactonase
MTVLSDRAVAPPVIVGADADALIEATADRVAELLSEAVRARGVASMALAGGRTPQALYRLLAKRPSEGRPPWSCVRLFMGDERWVPADHADSNQRMVRESLLTGLRDSPAFYPMPTDGTDPALDAVRYQACLAREVPECDGDLPRFDLILLGMGEDGHTASLFPGTAILDEQATVAAVHVPKFDSWRLSLTLPVLNAARHVLFLVTGADKAPTLARVLGGGPRRDLPASLVNPREGDVEWHLDRPAAALLGALLPEPDS